MGPQLYVKSGVFFLFFLNFFNAGTDQTSGSILTVNGSNDVFSRKVLPFGGLVDLSHFREL